MGKKEKEYIVKEMLVAIGEDPKREGLKETPGRVIRMWEEMFRGYDINQIPKVTNFNNGVDGVVYDQMITDEGSFYSHCEHHIIPFFGKYYFAYIPHPKGKILGLSKVARVVDYFSSKLQIQERLVNEVLSYLWRELTIPSVFEYDKKTDTTKKMSPEIEPIAMGLVLRGEHLCKSMRGVKKQGQMTTTKLMGSFKDDCNARAEFVGWVNNNR